MTEDTKKNESCKEAAVWQKYIDESCRNQEWLKDRFLALDFFSLYLGDELNTHHFDWKSSIMKGTVEETFRVVIINLIGSYITLCAPAVSLFYEELYTLNPSWVVERSLCPPSKKNRLLMKRDGIRPFAIESRMPLSAFNVICLSMDFALSRVAVPWLIMESGIPLSAGKRSLSDPFVILGGAAMSNPAIMGDFCDLIFFGEGEEVLPELLRMIDKSRREGLSRQEILLKAVRTWDCLYAPVLYEQRFDENGRLKGTFPLYENIPEHIRYCRINDLDRCFVPVKPYIDYNFPAGRKSTHEISRGCEGRCSFCFAGMVSLPFRTRSSHLINKYCEETIRKTGNPSASFIAYNASSHPEINKILADTWSLVGTHMVPMSNRIDTFESNPEYCCFLSMLNNGRIVFGVEGASQRLRDMVSKNITEEDILKAMRLACREGYRTIKLMMIAGLPGERKEDLEELYAMALKIHRIFGEETPEGEELPVLKVTWTPLIGFPHTPIQWFRVGTPLMEEYKSFADEMEKLGFYSEIPERTPGMLIQQLFERGDIRLSALLVHMAEKGLIDHQNSYREEELAVIKDYLKSHGLPSLNEWFRELSPEEPLPWDIVKSPASRQYLEKRYLSMKEDPQRSEPVCTAKCSGCGACSPEDRKRMDQISSLRKVDSKRDLHFTEKRNKREVQYDLLEFTYDLYHSFVIPEYWNCEIRLALNLAGISYDPYSLDCAGSSWFSRSAATGSNHVCIGLFKRYDPETLKKELQKHALNFRVKSISEVDGLMKPLNVTYAMKLPEGADEEALNAELQRRRNEDDLKYSFLSPHREKPVTANVKWGLIDAGVSDGYLKMKMDPEKGWPVGLYRVLLNIPPEEEIPWLPERVSIEWELCSS